MKHLKLFEDYKVIRVKNFSYEDDYVVAELRITDDSMEIFGWDSKYTEKGGTIKSLEKLKEDYNLSTIFAVDCGYEGDDSFEYWKHMIDLGHVDGMYDNDGKYYEFDDLF